MGPTNPPIGRWVRDPLMNRSLARERGRERRGREGQKGIPAAAVIGRGRRQQRGAGGESEESFGGGGGGFAVRARKRGKGFAERAFVWERGSGWIFWVLGGRLISVN